MEGQQNKLDAAFCKLLLSSSPYFLQARVQVILEDEDVTIIERGERVRQLILQFVEETKWKNEEAMNKWYYSRVKQYVEYKMT